MLDMLCIMLISSLAQDLPTGGSVQEIDNLRYHVFTSSGNFSVPLGYKVKVDVVVIGGGGGGGSYVAGGGGGGGGVVIVKDYDVYGHVTVDIGEGGAGATPSTRVGSNGGQSSFGEIIAYGGGGGGGCNYNGNKGASGGGGGSPYSSTTTSGGLGISGQGMNGGGGKEYTASSYNYGPGGGGGGFGQAGGSAVVNSRGGHGGTGYTLVTPFSTLLFAGGGGGGVHHDKYPTPGNGQFRGGKGGQGGKGTYHGGAAAVNSGSGGGGGGGGMNGEKPTGNGGKGGSGYILVNYSISNIKPIPTHSGKNVRGMMITFLILSALLN